MSDGTGTMSMQLVLCVADSVWLAAGHLARRRFSMPTAHSHRAVAGCALIPLPSQSVPSVPRPQLVMAWLCCCCGCRRLPQLSEGGPRLPSFAPTWGEGLRPLHPQTPPFLPVLLVFASHLLAQLNDNHRVRAGGQDTGQGTA